MPATANSIGKIANVICDDLLTASAMAYDKGIIFCPGMNPLMWNSVVLQDNIKYLKKKENYFLNRKGKVVEVENLEIIETDCAFPSPQELCKILYEFVYKNGKINF